LPYRLLAEKEGILADMVAHAAEFYANGRRLDPPRQVMQAVADYRETEDVLARFFEGWAIDPEGKAAVRGGEFYRPFLQWYRAEIDPDGRDMPGSRTFGEVADARYGGKKIGGYIIYRVIPAGERRARSTP
jgi:phage/plasmid-associated DNA primase